MSLRSELVVNLLVCLLAVQTWMLGEKLNNPVDENPDVIILLTLC